MRKLLFSLCMLSMSAVCLSQQQQYKPQQQQQQKPQSQYTQKYDNFNSDGLVQNDRILLHYYKCIMDQGPCTKDGKLFKRVLPEALLSKCALCTEKQTLLVRKMLLAIKAKSEPRFDDLISKFDGNGKYKQSIYNFILTGQ